MKKLLGKKDKEADDAASAPADEPVVPVFIPPLVTLLVHHEREKGSPLTQEEVLAIRGKAVCMTMRLSMALEMAERRGYADIPPETCWESWCEFRKQLEQDNPDNPNQ
jgi:hypothetical protein